MSIDWNKSNSKNKTTTSLSLSLLKEICADFGT